MYSFFRKPLEKKIFFLHVPKCGGTSLDDALAKKFKKSQVFRLNSSASGNAAVKYYSISDITNDDYYHVLKFRESILFYAMSQERIRYVSGHYAFNREAYEAFHEQFAYITIVREPTRRYISHYFYNRYKEEKHCSHNMDLEEFLASTQGNALGTEYVKFFGGLREDYNYRSRDAINTAKSNLRKFDIVGRLEDMNNLYLQLEKLFKIRIRVRRLNPSPVSNDFRKRYLTSDVLKQIENICVPDLEIYHSISSF